MHGSNFILLRLECFVPRIFLSYHSSENLPLGYSAHSPSIPSSVPQLLNSGFLLIFHVSQVTLFIFSPLYPPAKPLLATWVFNCFPIYTVCHIVDVHPLGHGNQYFGEWEGFGPEESSLVSLDSWITVSSPTCNSQQFPLMVIHQGTSVEGEVVLGFSCCVLGIWV